MMTTHTPVYPLSSVSLNQLSVFRPQQGKVVMDFYLGEVVMSRQGDRFVARIAWLAARQRLRTVRTLNAPRQVRSKSGTRRLCVSALDAGVRCSVLDGFVAHVRGQWSASEAWAAAVADMGPALQTGVALPLPDLTRADLLTHARAVVELYRSRPGLSTLPLGELFFEGYQIGMELLRRGLDRTGPGPQVALKLAA